MTKITSLAQLAPTTEDYTITKRTTGEEFTVTLRDILPDEIAVLDARRKRVKPPIDSRNPFGKGGVPNFNEEDPAYIEASEKAANEYVYMWLLATWVVEYPKDAETADQKIEVIRQMLPQWALNELAQRLREIAGLKFSDVALEKKRLKQTNSES